MEKVLYTFILIFLASVVNINGQTTSLPNNVKEGKCYVRCFNYKTTVDWEEIDCSTKKNKTETTVTIQQKKEKKEKFKAYQSKLIELGYKLTINGIADDKTIIAHNNYLLKKRKQEKKRLRIERRRNKRNK